MINTKIHSHPHVLIILLGYFLFMFCELSAQTPGQCDNLGFVDGVLNDWKFSTGCHPNANVIAAGKYSRFCHKNGNAGCCPKDGRVDKGNNSQIDIWDARHTLMGGPGSNIIDKFGNFNVVPPEIDGYPKSNYSVRLGNAIVYGEADQMERTFDITNDNAIFAYQFAFVLNDPTTLHDVNGGPPYFELPYFEAGIYDGTDKAVKCSQFIILANDQKLEVINNAETDTVNGGMMTVRYKEWTPVFMDLTDYVGQKLTIRFKNSDCAKAGHWGYSYVSAFCGPYVPMEDTIICANEPVTLTSPFPKEGFELEWSTGETTEEITVNPAVTTTYTLTVKNKTPFDGISADCEKKYEVTVTVIEGDPPVLEDNEVCAGGSVTLVAEPQGVDYEWYDAATGGNLVFTGDRFTTPPLFATTTYYVVNPAECAPKERVPVTVVIKEISVDAGPDVAICSGGSVQLNATGGEIYVWEPDDGSLNDINIADPIASPTKKTTYIVTATDASGECVAYDTVVVDVGEISVDAGPDVAICSGGSVQLNATGGGEVYLWKPDDGSLSNIKIANPVASPTKKTTYIVKATDASGECIAYDTVVVDVGEIVADAGPDATICLGDSAQLNASGGELYEWTPTNGLSNPRIPNPKASPQVTTTYTVKVNDAAGLCEDTDEVTVTVEEVDAKIEGTDVCIGFVTEFTNLTTPLNLANANWEWEFGDNNTSGEKQPTHTYDQPGTYKVLMSVSAGTCTDTTSTEVMVHPNPVAAFTPTPRKTTADDPLITFIDESVGADKGTWDFGDNAVEDYVPGEDKVHVYYATNEGEGPFKYTITLSVESEFGCKDEISHPIEIDNIWTIYVPNSFTPNGDGINDYFKAYGMGIIEFKMTIFNRWGEVVYRSNNLNDGWDGTPISGSNMKQDVYVWKIKAQNNRGKVIRLVGHVSLLPGEQGD